MVCRIPSRSSSFFRRCNVRPMPSGFDGFVFRKLAAPRPRPVEIASRLKLTASLSDPSLIHHVGEATEVIPAAGFGEQASYGGRGTGTHNRPCPLLQTSRLIVLQKQRTYIHTSMVRPPAFEDRCKMGASTVRFNRFALSPDSKMDFQK